MHAEPLKLLHGLTNALHGGAGLNIDDFRPQPQPSSATGINLEDRKTLVVTCDEDPKQPEPELLQPAFLRRHRNLSSVLPASSYQQPYATRMKGFHMLLYNVKVRMMLRREEHHRLVNDADCATRQESLWGRMLVQRCENI